MEELSYDLFHRCAHACNLAGAFQEALDGNVTLINGNLKDVKVFTENGKVSQRIMPLFMESIAYIMPPNCSTKYSMLSVLLGKAGIPAADFRWRGRQDETSETAKQFTQWAMEYLSYKFPTLRFENETPGYTPKVRTDVLADVLDSIVI
jgi:hypothetical protein